MTEPHEGRQLPLSKTDERERCYKHVLTHLRGLEMSRLLDNHAALALINSLHKLYKMAGGEWNDRQPQKKPQA